MSDLQAALDKYDRTGSAYGNVGLFVTAARKYANLHGSIDLDRLEEGLRFAHITDSDGEYLIYVAHEVADALEIGKAPGE